MHDMEDTHVLSMCMALHCNLPPLRQWVKGQDVEVASKLPPATSWLLSEASFVLEDEEGGAPDARGESPHGLSVITVSEDEEGGGGG